MKLSRAARVILIGAPGVGKGTQSERLLQRFPDLQSISTGDLLRKNVKERTPLGIKVEGVMKSGDLVADDLMMRVISSELYTRGWLVRDRRHLVTLAASPIQLEAESETPSPSSHSSNPPLDGFITSPAILDTHAPPHASDDPAASFILDGYPRTARQAGLFDRIIPINLVVALRTPLEVIMERIAGRWVHEPSGRVYNTTFNAPRVPGLDDITGEPLVKRADDNVEIHRNRYLKFQETSEPLLEHYAKKGVLWEVEGMSSNEISPKLYAEFERRFVH
jgi:adenylate kinase